MASSNNNTNAFDDAIKFLSSSSSLKLTDTQKLRIYALFKQATVGANNTPKPSFFDFVGKAKWEAWNQVRDLSQDHAKHAYVQELTVLAPDWRLQAAAAVPGAPKSAAQSGGGLGGPRVSRMMVGGEENAQSDSEEGSPQNIAEFAAVGDLPAVQKALKSGTSVDWKDSESRTALHRAADRGHDDVVKCLLEARANPNAQDSTGGCLFLHVCLFLSHSMIGSSCTCVLFRSISSALRRLV